MQQVIASREQVNLRQYAQILKETPVKECSAEELSYKKIFEDIDSQRDELIENLQQNKYELDNMDNKIADKKSELSDLEKQIEKVKSPQKRQSLFFRVRAALSRIPFLGNLFKPRFQLLSSGNKLEKEKLESELKELENAKTTFTKDNVDNFRRIVDNKSTFSLNGKINNDEVRKVISRRKERVQKKIKQLQSSPSNGLKLIDPDASLEQLQTMSKDLRETSKLQKRDELILVNNTHHKRIIRRPVLKNILFSAGIGTLISLSALSGSYADSDIVDYTSDFTTDASITELSPHKKNDPFLQSFDGIEGTRNVSTIAHSTHNPILEDSVEQAEEAPAQLIEKESSSQTEEETRRQSEIVEQVEEASEQLIEENDMEQVQEESQGQVEEDTRVHSEIVEQVEEDLEQSIENDMAQVQEETQRQIEEENTSNSSSLLSGYRERHYTYNTSVADVQRINQELNSLSPTISIPMANVRDMPSIIDAGEQSRAVILGNRATLQGDEYVLNIGYPMDVLISRSYQNPLDSSNDRFAIANDMAREIQTFTSALVSGCNTTREKVEVVYNFICDNVTYDRSLANNVSNGSLTSEDVNMDDAYFLEGVSNLINGGTAGGICLTISKYMCVFLDSLRY